ncbi:hypothetical protein TRFO_42853 [Tritrichomonas foetus]|uniref:Uncharacterized protein n=1 Tax=Tritrichomonas foetus TaxID=1144522 RepID=A0A1J4KUB7_9EUKA|nr:hypothetical protein TRFO_42853 [Tritrichomonas foetus]|eukprot:OHT14873.1 hypothetical protein TRFO_42853 [Tritrichomonas foetus]
MSALSPRSRASNASATKKTTKPNRGPLSPARKAVGSSRGSPFKKEKARTVSRQSKTQVTEQQQQKQTQQQLIDEQNARNQEAIDHYNQLLQLRDEKIAERNALLERKQQLLQQPGEEEDIIEYHEEEDL